MTEAIKRAEELRQNAIALLLEEKLAVEEKLAQFGWENGTPAPKKGRVKTCSLCSGENHTAPTCPTKAKDPILP
jgi:hypothetical protein